MPKTVPEVDRAELCALLALGHSQAEASRRLGIARTTIRKMLREPKVKALLAAFVERVEAASVDVVGATAYRSGVLLSALLQAEVEAVRAGKPPSVSLKEAAGIHKQACEAQRQAAALALLGGKGGAMPRPSVETDERDPDDPRPQAKTSTDPSQPETARSVDEWLRRFAGK